MVAEVTDSGLMVQREGTASQGAPLLDVVLTGNSQIYYDLTNCRVAEQHLVDGNAGRMFQISRRITSNRKVPKAPRGHQPRER
jgi:hypothetical protein